MEIYGAIDPGYDGATVLLHCGTGKTIIEIEKFVFPCIGKRKADHVDKHWISNKFFAIANLDVNKIHFVIEDVHSVYGASAEGNFNFGGIMWALEQVLIDFNIPYTKVQPKVWQKEMWQGIPLQKKPSSTGKTMVNDTKAMSEMAAKRLFPVFDLRATERSKKSHDGIVDALLMAEYCRRKF